MFSIILAYMCVLLHSHIVVQLQCGREMGSGKSLIVYNPNTETILFHCDQRK